MNEIFRLCIYTREVDLKVHRLLQFFKIFNQACLHLSNTVQMNAFGNYWRINYSYRCVPTSAVRINKKYPEILTFIDNSVIIYCAFSSGPHDTEHNTKLLRCMCTVTPCFVDNELRNFSCQLYLLG